MRKLLTKHMLVPAFNEMIFLLLDMDYEYINRSKKINS